MKTNLIVLFGLLFASSAQCQSLEELKRDQKECYSRLKKNRKNMVACLQLKQSHLDLERHKKQLIEDSIDDFLRELVRYESNQRLLNFVMQRSKLNQKDT